MQQSIVDGPFIFDDRPVIWNGKNIKSSSGLFLELITNRFEVNTATKPLRLTVPYLQQ